MAKHSNILLLGMVFSSEAIPKRGQEYRDRVRCEALERLNYKVKTLDNKHSDITLLNHCTANFSDTRRMIKAITSKWGSETFDHVILDYFMSPVKYAHSIGPMHCPYMPQYTRIAKQSHDFTFSFTIMTK